MENRLRSPCRVPDCLILSLFRISHCGALRRREILGPVISHHDSEVVSGCIWLRVMCIGSLGTSSVHTLGDAAGEVVSKMGGC
jgi:hypothetical protein